LLLGRLQRRQQEARAHTPRSLLSPPRHTLILPSPQAVNFATAEWLPFALQAAARLRRLGVDHILPTEALLVAEAEAALQAAGLGPGGATAAAEAAAIAEAVAGAQAATAGATVDAAAAAAAASGGSAAAPATPPQPAGSAPTAATTRLPPAVAVALGCFLRRMRWLNAVRRDLLSRGVGLEWLGDDEAYRSLPCCRCREPAFLGVVLPADTGEVLCLRCAAPRAELGGGRAVLLVRRAWQGLEARAR
jgi:hypothetical protein